jgi:hypothetical protein
MSKPKLPELYVDSEGRAVRTGRLVHSLTPGERAAVAARFIPQYATDRVDVEVEPVRGNGVFHTVRLYLQVRPTKGHAAEQRTVRTEV